MRRDTALFRLAVLAACAGLAAFGLPAGALAQGAGILPDTVAAAPAEPEVNPPALVGALIGIDGTVSFHAVGADQWDQAVLNYPVTSGVGLWTQPDARARVSIGDALVGMAGATDFEVGSLDSTGLVATLPQGEVYLQVRSLFPGQTLSVVTPRGSVTIAAPGRYDLVAGAAGSPTVIAVFNGAAALGEGAAGTIQAGQAAIINGEAAPFQVQLATAQQTPFVAEMLAREKPRPVAGSVAPPPLVADMPGGEELQAYGTWSMSPDYGEVWYPQVAAGWVPYREGHWAYVAPWGWTWVDDDPWGFAPFHYGRWAEIGGRWGWIPGGRRSVAEAPAYPVYAPALVTFFGAGAAVGATAALLHSGHVGWVPLGPGEVYRPWFHASPHYIRNVNIRHVTSITQINTVINNRTVNNTTINRFRNVRGATVVPAAAMATSRPIRTVGRRPDAQMLRSAHAVYGRQPLRPTTATLGVTPRTAREFHAVAPPAGAAAPHRRAAPGPAIRHPAARATRSTGPAARSPAAAAAHVRPALRPAEAHHAAPTAARPAIGAPHPAPQARRPQTAHPPVQTEARPAPRVERAPQRPAVATPRPARPEAAHPPARAEVHATPRSATHTAPRPENRRAPHLAPPPQVRPAPRPEVHAAPRPAVHAAPGREVRAAPRPEVHAAPRPEVRAAPRPQVHSAPRPAAHAARRPAVHEAPRPQPHAAPHPAGRPAPQHEKRPGER